ncbi:MAG: transglutaminase-like cysteine peptidase [Thauera sp.]
MLHALLTHLRRLYQAAALAALVGGLPLVLASADGARMEEIARTRYGEAVAASVRDWRALLVDPAIVDERERLSRVNAFFNRRLRFDDDINIWKEADYWATPLESMARGAGDCEDFAIAKYASLLVAGVPSERLRLIYVRARIGGPQSSLSQAHMVLGYYPTPEAEPLILDNLVSEIRPASRRPDLFPIFSFTSEGLWVQGASASSADPTARLSRWRSVLQRMRTEGLDLQK